MYLTKSCDLSWDPSRQKIEKTDILNIDVTVIKDGYYGDTSKMFCIGKPTIMASRLIEATQECLYAAIAKVKPGNTLNDCAREIESIVNILSIIRKL